MSKHKNAETLQSVISDDLFPTVHHISDVKQVLEEMKGNAQNLTQEQIKALLLLEQLGSNEYLHKDDPYKDLRTYIVTQGKKDVADPSYFIDTIEALIPKPPRPILLKDREEKK